MAAATSPRQSGRRSPSLMLREIFEQPAALERTLAREVRRVRRFGRFLAERDIRLVVFAARGTSDNAALFGRYLTEITCGLPVSLAAPSVHTLYRAPLRLEHALVVGLSQSGESTDVNLVLEEARRHGALTLGITNEPGSTLARLADEVFLVHAGKERSVAATKTYTGQLLLLHLLAAVLAGRSVWPEIERLPELAAASLALDERIATLVERYRFMNRCVVVGRGLAYANAFELAIKLMETCYVVADRFSSADFVHGPVAMVERGFPVFLFAPPGRTHADMGQLTRRLAGLGAETIVLSSEPGILSHATSAIRLPRRLPEALTAIPYIVPAQLFAARLADVKGLNPDAPRSLSKVTRTL
jgi:glucosamine--fructose-6-phosphate aminotransferase (isomerizing)